MILKKISRITWITSLFLILIITLLLIMHYKINYEYLNYNYLYFYECDGNLCMSNIKDSSKLIYSEYKCGYDSCPSYIKSIKDDYVLLKKDTEYLLYNYRTAAIISDDYEEYEFINSNYIIVTSAKKKGIINLQNEKITEIIYDDIGYKSDNYLSGYNLNNIIVQQNSLYGIISFKSGTIIEDIKYTESELSYLLDVINEK